MIDQLCLMQSWRDRMAVVAPSPLERAPGIYRSPREEDSSRQPP
ncbi:hypothetical protein OG206_19060 [Streptomyces sp. NBC_01341]|nr:hypothetical protein OG206_19060 [Streptomyces sp. NBC_01341]